LAKASKTSVGRAIKAGGLSATRRDATAARAREAAIDRLPNFMERLDSPRPDVADDARQMRTEIERKRVPIP